MSIQQPLLSDPNAPRPDRIIAAVEKSRPPVYSPELAALLTSDVARPSKALNKKYLATPPSLPARADPKSEDARLLGPLSKRREVNIRWRYFTEEWKKTWPPAHVEMLPPRSQASDPPQVVDSNETARMKAGIRPVGFQDAGIYEALVAAAGPAIAKHTTPRREHAERGTTQPNPEPESKPLPRFIRRRYRELLARMPVLTYQPSSGSPNDRKGKYGVSRAANSLDVSTSYSVERVPPAHDSYLAWMGQSAGTANGTNKK